MSNLSKKDKEIKELKERIKYLQADFDNLRKQFELEKKQLIALANKELIKDTLDVLDDFESALKNEQDEEKVKGIKMIYNKLLKILGSKGLKPLDSLGEEFDPSKHEAFIKEGEGNKVIEELQRGYMLNNYVIRTSKVKIGGGTDDKRKDSGN